VTAVSNFFMALFWLLGQARFAPIISLFISLLYFHLSPRQHPAMRVLTSAHGLTVFILFVMASSVRFNRIEGIKFLSPFEVAQLIPLVLIGLSLYFYSGPKRLHWLQIVNLPCMALSYFIGVMAITGNWI
jgi:phosphatidylserine synthase